MFKLFIFILIFSFFDIIQSELTCSIENEDKKDCAPGIEDLVDLQTTYDEKGCC